MIGAFFCLDSKYFDSQVLRGTIAGGDHTLSDVMGMPCHMKESLVGGTQDNIRNDCEKNSTAVYEYLSNMSTVFWYNYGSFKQKEFGNDDRVSKKSNLEKYKTTENVATWRGASIHISQLQDETDFFQWGQFDEVEFQDFKIAELRPSSFKNWPTDDEPDNKYKFSSLVMYLDQDVTSFERKTYSSLEWLGDIGGLFDAMRIIGQAIVAPVAIFATKAELMKQAFGSQINKFGKVS